MIAEAFGRSAWIPHDSPEGIIPVDDGVLVDVKYRDGEKEYNLPANKLHGNYRDASYAFWRSEQEDKDIVAWRLSVPTGLPKPPIKPPKQEFAPVNLAIVQAFNAMTGQDLTDDQLQTLTILLKHFSPKSNFQK